MTVAVRERAPVVVAADSSAWADALRATGRYLRRNPSLVVGSLLLLALLLFLVVGSFMVDPLRARPISVRSLQPPSPGLWFGSDRQGRDLFAVIIVGTPLSLRIGLIAGFLGVSIGAVLAFVSAYYGGVVDAVIRAIVDVGLTVPGLMVLIVLAMTMRTSLTVDQMALIIASLAWLNPARIIRSQVLTLKERSFVQVARFSGMSGPKIIFYELLPNLLPYLVAALVSAVTGAILASVGLELLGLGPFDSPDLGMTFYWVNYNAAIINGWWWWWLPPLVVIVVLFLGLYFLSFGLDEFANPRLRRQV